MTDPSPSAAQLVSRYAARLWSQWDGDFHITSPLGVWLLLAQIAPAATGPARDELTDALGCDPDRAADLAAELLREVHPEVASAVAVWARDALCNDRWRQWATSLPYVLERGDVPSQADADTWTRDRTMGILDRFPVPLTAQTALVLASALATKLRWPEPFDVTGADALGGPLAQGLTEALVTEASYAQQMLVASTQAAGDVAVLVTYAVGGVRVLSVVPLDADVAPSDVHRGALELAQLDGDALAAASHDWWSLPEGERDVLVVVDEAVRSTNGDRVSTGAVLPAWSAETDQSVATAPGVPAALTTGLAMLVDPEDATAVQAARARFDRFGFEAAAVTVFGFEAAGAPPFREVELARLRRVVLRFCRPFVAVAQVVPRGDRHFTSSSSVQPAPGGPWAGVPVFSAWVDASVEPERPLPDEPEQSSSEDAGDWGALPSPWEGGPAR